MHGRIGWAVLSIERVKALSRLECSYACLARYSNFKILSDFFLPTPCNFICSKSSSLFPPCMHGWPTTWNFLLSNFYLPSPFNITCSQSSLYSVLFAMGYSRCGDWSPLCWEFTAAFKPVVDQNLAMHAYPCARSFFLSNFYLPHPFSFLPSPSSLNFSLSKFSLHLVLRFGVVNKGFCMPAE